MKYLGYIFIALVIFALGFIFGAQPTTQQIQEKAMGADLSVVSQKYQSLYSLCEEKYQTGIKGDMNGAYQIKGQMDVLETQINQILAKYNTKAL